MRWCEHAFWRSLLAIAAFVASAALAEPAPRRHHVAYWGGYPHQAHEMPPASWLKRSLARHGLATETNLRLDILLLDATSSADEHARRLVGWKPDVIVVDGTGIVWKMRALTKATRTVPIVFLASGEVDGPVFDATTPNVTGSVARDVTAKRIEVVRDLLPNARRIAALWPNQVDIDHNGASLTAAAQAIGLEILHVPAGLRRGNADWDSVLERIEALRPDAWLSVALIHTDDRCRRFAAFERRSRIPYIGDRSSETGGQCGVMHFSYDEADLRDRAADMAVRVLRGARPADLPLDHAIRYRLVVDPRAAAAIGLAVPPSLLVRADVVVR